MTLIALSLFACKDGGGADTAPTNSAPEITSLALTPSEAGVEDPIVAAVEASDADGDTLSYSYAWTVDGEAAGDDSDTLPAGTATKGQSVVVSVSVSDGEEEVSSESAALTIGNTAPAGGAVSILPGTPSAGEDLICRLTTEPTDADGDALGYTVTWTVDGVAVSPQGVDTELPDDHVLASQTRGEETWACEITADDGEASITLAASVTLPPAPQVLIIWDTESEGTPGLVSALEDSGAIVTLSDTDETGYTGLNPAPDAFDTVIHLNGTTYTTDMPTEGQTALVDFVDNGGGFISTEWDAYEVLYNRHQVLQAIVPMRRDNGSGGTFTEHTLVGEHPVTDSLPETFTVTANCNGNVGSAVEAAQVLATTVLWGDTVAVMSYGSGRVAGFAYAGNYANDSSAYCLNDPAISTMMVNAVWWTAGM
ncbi:MAG: hypothetical protein VX899_27405 [Myxococcota bacterium]|nr:hypothetical protein [Myxococcota bacterium]